MSEEEGYRHIGDASDSLIYVFDRELRITFTNRPGAALLDKKPEDVTGKSLEELFPPDISVPMMICFRRILESGKPVNMQHPIIYSGRNLWLNFSLTPEFDDHGQLARIICITRDITGPKETEKALQENEEKYRLIVETAEEGIWVIDSGYRTTFVNQKLADMLGYSTDELVRKSPFELLDMNSSYPAAVDIGVHGSAGHWRVTRKFIRKDGSELWAIISTSNRFDGGGNFNGFIAMITDITDLKKTELAMYEAKAQAELYLDLMGHDINNMNQIGIGFLELALDSLSLDENSRILISKPLAAFESSTRLIQNVRKLQKVRAGELRYVKMDLGQVLRDVHYHYSSIPGNQITINYLPAGDCLVTANELLYDLFSNLVGNAIKHSNGTPFISIGLEKVTDKDREHYRITVEDDGPGIPDEMKTSIFSRHLKGNNKTKGSGLGLYLVHTLAEDYGGRVWVEDRVRDDRSQGSRFVVLLPADENNPPSLDERRLVR